MRERGAARSRPPAPRRPDTQPAARQRHIRPRAPPLRLRRPRPTAGTQQSDAAAASDAGAAASAAGGAGGSAAGRASDGSRAAAVIHRTFRSLDDAPKLVGFTIRQWAALIAGSAVVLGVVHLAQLPAKPAITLCVLHDRAARGADLCL